MGDGIQRTSVRFLSYLFYVADRKKTDLPYMDESDSSDEWYRLRNEEAMDPDHIVALVCRHSSCRSALRTMEGSVRVGQLCSDFGLMWGLPLKQPLRYFSCNGCSVRGSSSGQTQWYRYTLDPQEGRNRLTKNPMPIVGGRIEGIDKMVGLGIEVDREQVLKANKLYVENCLGARDDATGMQYLIPGWKFDNKKPCLVR